MIKKEKGKYVLFSKDGNKKLGTFDTEKEAQDREKEINAAKNAALVEVSLYITKASQQEDGTMRWLATCSDTEKDKTNQATSVQLFNDWIERAETDKSLSWLPAPRTPFLGLSHYPGLDGFGEAGLTTEMWVQGNQFKAGGVFYGNEDHPLGKALFESVHQERALIEKGESIEEPIRISAGWWDIAHKHGDFIFERKSMDDVCSMCASDAGDKTYLKGQLDHFAATRVPINPRTDLSLELKAMTTRKKDAESIINDPELVEKLDDKTKAITSKSETELPDGMVVKMDHEETSHLPFGGATSLQEAESFFEAQEQVNEVHSEWALFRIVVQNILEISEPQEIKGKVSSVINEFSSRVEAIKASVEDVILLQPIGDDNMADEKKVEVQQSLGVEAVVAEAMKNPQLNRQQKTEVIQKAVEGFVETIKSELDVVAPPDPNEAVQKAILEQLQLLNAKSGTTQVPQQTPVQKSLMPDGSPIPTQANQLPISPITGKPSALTAQVMKSVQAR